MISEEDISILKELRKNARAGIAEMSVSASIPESEVPDKLKKLEVSMIKKYSSIVNFDKLGFKARYLFLVKSDDSCRQQVREFLVENHSVNNIYVTNSGYDFLFEGIFRNNKEMDEFKKDIDRKHHILMLRHHELIEDIEREKFLEI
jgi:DNA-binding Lrp family transcriptional regulator